jgi:enoyl-[acyl-carrier protein] reductase II
MFDIEVPVFLAGMGGVAYAEICAAVSEAGGYGTLGMIGIPTEEIREEMREVRRRTAGPFGVDLVAALPDAVQDAIEVIIEEGASSFISGLGVPGPVIGRCHEAGVKVMVVCGRVKHAQAAEAAGCDVVVAQGSEAGGHTGRVAGMALIPQIVDAVDIPVLAAGSIVDGRGLAAALALGAQGVWMGTRFVASQEARAGQVYQSSILEKSSDDTHVTRCYSGKTMRVIDNAYVQDWEKRADEIQPFPAQIIKSIEAGVLGFSLNDYEELDPNRSCMPAGQGIGGIDEVLPAREIIERVVAEARETIRRLGQHL